MSALVVNDGREHDRLRAFLIDAGARVSRTSMLHAVALQLSGLREGELDLLMVDADAHPEWDALAERAVVSCGVLITSRDADAGMLSRVLASQVGYVSRQVALPDFVFAVVSALRMGTPHLGKLAARGARLWMLSPQLTRLLHYNLWGYSDRDIADAMSITVKTTQQYQEELRHRTGVKTKQAYLRRLLMLAGREPLLPMTEDTRVRVEHDRRRTRSSGVWMTDRAADAPESAPYAGPQPPSGSRKTRRG